MLSMIEFQEKAALIQATALLICRVNEAWTIEQTMELHPDLVADLAKLYTDEDNKTIDALEEASNNSGAEEGKS